MKKTGATSAQLTPATAGWNLQRAGARATNFPSLAEAATALPPETRVHLALPLAAVLIERMTVPATDRTELAGMVELQLEKSLPFPVGEVSADFEIVARRGSETTLVAIAAQHATIEKLCAPLRERGLLPGKITPFVLHAAAACPAAETVFAVFSEHGQFVLAICQNGKLGWAQLLPASDAETLIAELPQTLLAAEMEGVPAHFSRVLVAPDCAHLQRPLSDFFSAPATPLALDSAPEPAMNLVPPAWQTEVARGANAERLKQRLMVAAVVYLLALAGAFAWLAWLKNQARRIDAQLAAAHPQLELVQARQVRWNALAPAVDRTRYTVELLFQLHKNLPTDALHITEFDQTLAQWTAVGEGPSANLAIDYVARLKHEKELAVFQINAGPPKLLPNDHAGFTVVGKL